MLKKSHESDLLRYNNMHVNERRKSDYVFWKIKDCVVGKDGKLKVKLCSQIILEIFSFICFNGVSMSCCMMSVM